MVAVVVPPINVCFPPIADVSSPRLLSERFPAEKQINAIAPTVTDQPGSFPPSDFLEAEVLEEF